MIIYVQFFPDYKETTTSPISEKEWNIWIFQVEYDPAYQDVILEKGKAKIIDIWEKPIQQELPEAKKSRITLALITSEDPTKVDTEWVTWFDLDYMILQRFFGGDRGKEIWFTQRFAYLLAFTDLTEDQNEEKILIIEWYESKEKYKEFIKSLNK